MIEYGSDCLLGLACFAPEKFAERDRLWRNGDARYYALSDALPQHVQPARDQHRVRLDGALVGFLDSLFDSSQLHSDLLWSNAFTCQPGER